MLGNRLQRHAAYRTDGCEFSQGQPIGPTKAGCILAHTVRSNPYSSEEQVDVGCVPGMNGSALRISQSVRDAAHITITVPQTCPFLNARAKTMSSVTLCGVDMVVTQQVLKAALGRWQLRTIRTNGLQESSKIV